MRIEIVNHTHKYPRLLAYQLSSLILHPTEHEVYYSVFYDPQDDFATETVLNNYQPRMPRNVRILRERMMVRFIRNRAIGRNTVAKRTNADWVWFTDTDYVFGEDCLNLLPERAAAANAEFVWPGEIMETDWDDGDAAISEVEDLTKLYSVDPAKTYAKKMRRGIGGVQIAHGPTVRRLGYCPDFPQKSSPDWLFKSDVQFRRQFETKKEIAVPNVLRIRHSKKGYGTAAATEVMN
jgi:hypothetical protein